MLPILSDVRAQILPSRGRFRVVTVHEIIPRVDLNSGPFQSAQIETVSMIEEKLPRKLQLP